MYHTMDLTLISGLPAACGICRCFPQDVLYTPIKFQGVGLKNIHIAMGLRLIDLTKEKLTPSRAGLSEPVSRPPKAGTRPRLDSFPVQFKKTGKLADSRQPQ
jgi:hypothetical protein